MKRKLDFGELIPIYKEVLTIGTKNAIPILITVFLYSITNWIPYINVGTSIAMATLPGKLAQGEIINPTFIFDSVYRKQMGNFFLFITFYLFMLVAAILFLNIFVPVILIMYSLSLYIMIDAEVNPLEALEMSRKATHGFKIDIFLLHFFFEFVVAIIALIFTAGLISSIIEAVETYSDYSTQLMMIFVILAIIFILTSCWRYALSAVIYRNLFLKAHDPEVEGSKEIES